MIAYIYMHTVRTIFYLDTEPLSFEIYYRSGCGHDIEQIRAEIIAQGGNLYSFRAEYGFILCIRSLHLAINLLSYYL